MAEKRETAKLGARQRMAAELLGCGVTRREAAERLGVSERTITNWRGLSGFQEAADEAERAFVAQMRPRAWDVFSKHLEDEDKKIAQQAAGQVLKMAESMMAQESEKAVYVWFSNMPRPGEAGGGQT